MSNAAEDIDEMLRRAAPPYRWPALIDITAGADAVPPFPLRLLPEPFGTFAADVADRMQLPSDFVAIPLLVSAATMLGRDLRITPKRHDDWTERACLWGATIGIPSALKSPAAAEAMRPVRKMQAEAWERYDAARREWRRRQKAGDTDDEAEPRFEALIVNDTTVEALANTILENPRGVMLQRDELSAFFSGMNKYRNHGGDDRQFYLQCWSGGAHRVDRVSKPPIYVDDLFLAIFGTLQPEVMRRAFKGGDEDGMTARFGLLAYPDLPLSADFVDRRPDYDARAGVEARLREMRGIYDPNPLRFSGMAYAVFNDWLLQNVNRRERREAGGFGAHLAKYPALFARLSLTLHFMRYGSRADGEIGIETASAVREMIDEYLEPHARKIYGLLSAHPARAGAARIATWIRDDRVEAFTERAVRRHGWTEFSRERDGVAIGEAMALLEAYGWIALQDRPSPAGRGGRPTREAIVNPTVAEICTTLSK
jgi:putative DNA primase/helicase